MNENNEKQASEVAMSEEATTTTTPVTTGAGDSNKVMWIAGSIVVAVVLLLGALYLTDNLSGIEIKGEGAAVVNGTVITESELETQVARSRAFLQSQGGGDISEDELRKSVLDGMINQTLLLQVAGEAGLSVTSADVDAYIAEIETQLPSGVILEEELTKNGVSMEVFREKTGEDLLVDAYLRLQLPEESYAVSEEDVKATYDLLVGQVQEGVEIPPFEEVSEAIKQQLVSEKLQTAQLEIVEALRAQAEIEINI